MTLVIIAYTSYDTQELIAFKVLFHNIISGIIFPFIEIQYFY